MDLGKIKGENMVKGLGVKNVNLKLSILESMDAKSLHHCLNRLMG